MYSEKQLLSNNSQNSRENTSDSIHSTVFLTKKDSATGVILEFSQNLLEKLFYRILGFLFTCINYDNRKKH